VFEGLALLVSMVSLLLQRLAHCVAAVLERKETMNKAIQEWRGGVCVWDVINSSGELINTVAHTDNREELIGRLQTIGTIDPAKGFTKCKVIETEEPRFLARDESGRGWCAEWKYTDIPQEDRAQCEDEEDEHCQTFGDWLDTSSAGNEYHDSDNMVTVIRIN
jgi:hypothetical protein